jgi:EmrB/QacA subfamily drug resistance transporter
MARKTRITLAVLTTAQFVIVLDAAVVGIALPSIQTDLGLDEGLMHWVNGGYALAFAGFVLLGGRVADAYGRRRVFVAGMLLFTLSSLACSVASGGELLVAGRIAQGLGGALAMPAALGILTRTFEDGPSRHRALGVWGSVGGAAAAVGVALGGLLTSAFGWSSAFLVNVPVGAAAVALAPFVLPESRPVRRSRFDLPGAGLAAAGLVLAVHGLASFGRDGWTSPRAALPLAAGAVALALLAVWERRAPNPLLPPRLIGRQATAGANLVGLAHGAMMLGVLLLVPLHAQRVLGYSPLATGAILLALRLTSSVTAAVTGRAAGRLGVRLVIVAGLALMTAGLALLAPVSDNTTLATGLLLPLVVSGAGVGIASVGVKAAALRCVRTEDGSVASGLLATSQWVGYALAIAVVSAGGLGSGPEQDALSIAEGLRTGFAVCAAFGLIGIVASVRLVAGRRDWGECPA